MFSSQRLQRRTKLVVTGVALTAFVLVTTFPVYWLVLTSLRLPKDIYITEAVLIPRSLTLDNYRQVLFDSSFPRWFLNSALVAVTTTSISMVISILAAFSLSRLRFRGTKLIAQGIFFMYLVPTALLYIPLYVLFARRLGVLDTQMALFLSYPTFIVPFCTWVLLGYFKTIPTELMDAALIDGCSHLQTLYHIVLPLAAPAVATTVIFGLSFAWNEMLYALTFVNSNALRTLPVGMTSFLQMELMRWGPAMATAFMASLPPVILYMFLQKSVVQGLTGGAVKG